MPKSSSTIPKPADMACVVRRNEGALLVETRPSTGPRFFLLLWLIGWTVGCVFLATELIAEPSLGTFCFSIPFFVAWLAVAAFLVWFWFGRESLLIKSDEVLFRRTAIIELTTRRLPRAEVSAVKSCRSSHTENDEHLDGIEIVCLGKSLKFGFRLSDHERAWIIQELSAVILEDDDSSIQPPALTQTVPRRDTHPDFSSNRLTPAETLSNPPSDSAWKITLLPNEVTFQRSGSFKVGGFFTMSFICLFWNGCVSVFVLSLFGLMPGNNQLQASEWWGLFFFLIPFEVIGVAFLFAWLAIVFAPFSTTTLGIRNQAVIRLQQWPFFQSSKKVNSLEITEIHLRESDGKRETSMGTIPSEETFELAFISTDQQDLIIFKQLSRGDALWIAGHLLEFEDTWAR